MRRLFHARIFHEQCLLMNGTKSSSFINNTEKDFNGVEMSNLILVWWNNTIFYFKFLLKFHQLLFQISKWLTFHLFCFSNLIRKLRVFKNESEILKSEKCSQVLDIQLIISKHIFWRSRNILSFILMVNIESGSKTTLQTTKVKSLTCHILLSADWNSPETSHCCFFQQQAAQ